MNRRSFLKGLTIGAAGLLVPKAGLVDAEEVRRVWALDRTMTDRSVFDHEALGEYFVSTSAQTHWLMVDGQLLRAIVQLENPGVDIDADENVARFVSNPWIANDVIHRLYTTTTTIPEDYWI